MKKRSTILFLFTCFFLFTTTALFADCNNPATIKSKQDGNFNDPKTWAGNNVPTSCDIIIIRHAVTLTSDFTVGQLVSGTLTIEAQNSLTGRTINIAANSTVINNGTLSLTGLSLWGTASTFQNTGTATVNNKVVANGTSTITNQGILDLNGGLDLNGINFTNGTSATSIIQGDLTLNGNSLTNNGRLRVSGSTTINQGKVVNAAAAAFTVGSNFTMNGGNSLTNHGSLKIGQNFLTNPVSTVENTDSLVVGENLTSNSIFKNIFGSIVVNKSFINSFSGVFTNDHGTILTKTSFINDYSGKFTNDYGLVTSAGDFYNRSKINGAGGGFKIAGYSENTWGATITGFVDITDTSLAAGKLYVDTNNGTIDSKTVTRNSYSEATAPIKGGITPLPVTFVLWKGSAQSNQVLLEWQTASEQNSASFAVERSRNGREFTPVASIPAAGNSQQLRSYSFTDRTALGGTVYYRLKQTDGDGTFEYTKIITVESKWQAVEMRAFPNPVTSNQELQLSLNASPDQDLLMEIMTLQGQVVYNRSVKATAANQMIAVPANVTGNLKGFCLVRCTDVSSGQVHTIKVLVQ